jgi:formate/nitrite transporter FocA (FNT family)
MVSTGVVGAMLSTTVGGKVIAMWMPIMLFFYMTFEHSIVNMFLFPSGPRSAARRSGAPTPAPRCAAPARRR